VTFGPSELAQLMQGMQTSDVRSARRAWHAKGVRIVVPPAGVPTPPEASEFESVYSQLGIQPLPPNVERQQQVQSRLDQLNREPCFTDAIVGLGRALLDVGYPRQAATSLRTFAKRCGNAREVLPLAYHALERINDFPGALEVANALVEELPANGTVRYWVHRRMAALVNFPLQ
jgi:hypothetical protein